MTTIAVVDDNAQAAEAVGYTLEDAGFKPWIFHGKGGTVESAVGKIKENGFLDVFSGISRRGRGACRRQSRASRAGSWWFGSRELSVW